MKRAVVAALLFAGLLGASWAAFRVAIPQPPSSDLSRYVPSGALLYLEAKDFSSILAQWDHSQEKSNWLGSPNYEVFSRSRLFLRLKDAGGEFSAAAGVPANADLLRQVAGTQTVLALYDVGKLQFLYITRLPSASFTESPLWRTRSSFETRTAGGVNFFYRKDPDSDREVAFTLTGDYLLMATRADLMAESLTLLKGGTGLTVGDESWWSRSVAAAGAPGDLRMILNLDKIVPSPYFRSYWIQQNITEMGQYSAALTDLTRSGAAYHEERCLLKKQASGSPEGKGAAALADILRLVPANAGFYEANADPDPKVSLAWLMTDILSPHPERAAAEERAPAVPLGNGQTGSAADLETRIDQAGVPSAASGGNRAALQSVLAANHILAQLRVERTDRDTAGVFVRFHSAVAFLGQSDWNLREVQAGLVEFVEPEFTTARMGLGWKTSAGYSVLDGLWPLSVATRGKYLIVSDDPTLVSGLLDGINKKATASPAIFAAGFDQQNEADSFVALTKLLDVESPLGASGASPEFFSGNIASLASTLKGVSSEKIVIRDAGDRQTQSVVYAWSH